MMTGVQFTEAIGSLIRRLGAVRVQVSPAGVASWWKTEFEAKVARVKFLEMGLLNAEKWKEKNGLWAVMAQTPDFVLSKRIKKQRQNNKPER